MCNNGTHDGHYTVSGAPPDRSALGNQSTVHTGDQSIVDVNTFKGSNLGMIFPNGNHKVFQKIAGVSINFLKYLLTLHLST